MEILIEAIVELLGALLDGSKTFKEFLAMLVFILIIIGICVGIYFLVS